MLTYVLMRNIIRFIALLSHDPWGKLCFLSLIYKQRNLCTVQSLSLLLCGILVMDDVLFKDRPGSRHLNGI